MVLFFLFIHRCFFIKCCRVASFWVYICKYEIKRKTYKRFLPHRKEVYL